MLFVSFGLGGLCALSLMAALKKQKHSQKKLSFFAELVEQDNWFY